MSALQISAITLSQIFGDFGFKSWVLDGDGMGFIKGGIGYIGVVFFLLKSLASHNILWINGMWSASTLIFESIAAYILLGERFDHKWQYVALGMIIVGVIALKWHDIHK